MRVNIESIVHFQSVEAFEEATELKYEELTDQQLLEALQDWWYPGEHDTNQYDSEHLNSSFLGYEIKSGEETFLLSKYESGLVIGLSRIVDRESRGEK